MTTELHKVDTKRLFGPALRTFFRLADQWELDRDEQMALLGLSATSTYHNWKSGQEGRPMLDTLERISYLLGIFKALQILLPDPSLADAWVKKPNNAIPFGGRSPLDYLVRGGKMQNLFEVRRYVDAQRGL